MKKISCTGAKQIDLVDYLASLGYHPQRIRNNDYWYLSPFREEKTASFKIDRRLNVWYDHGAGTSGDLIDFGTLYYNCSISELLSRLSQQAPTLTFSFHSQYISRSQHPAPVSFAGEKKGDTDGKIVILDSRPLADKSLLGYLQKRCIPPEIANSYCREVDFLLYGKQYTVIGFPNNAGGYELRSEYFKGSSSPKDITFVDNQTEKIAVFEGFFNFLSFCMINKDYLPSLTNCLILNSLSFFEKSRSLMEQHQRVYLLLDRDIAGRSYTEKALQWDKGKYIDRSDYYKDRKDLNDWLIHKQQSQRVARRMGRWL